MTSRLALLLALLAGPALAQGCPPGGPEGGPPRRDQLFISPSGEPFSAPRGQAYPVATWFARADANHDGVLTREEFEADARTFNATLDTDRDGFLDGFEIAAYERDVAPEILSPLDRGDEGPGAVVTDVGRRPFFGRARAVDRDPYGRHRSGAGLYGLINEVQPVAAQDSNLDRRIDMKEVIIAARDRFAILDTDRDGKLTLETLPRTPYQVILARPVRDGARPDKRPR